MKIEPPVVHPAPLPLFNAPFVTLLDKEVRRFLKVIVQTIVTPLVTAGLYLIIFGAGIGHNMKIGSGDAAVAYIDYLVPGLAMMGALSHAFNNSASSFMISKFQNNLVDILVTPLTDLGIAFAYSLASTLRGLMVGVLTWAVTLPFGGRFPAEPVTVLAILVFGSMAFAFLGVAAGVIAKRFDDIARISTFVILPLTYLGAVFIPITRYPESIQPFARLNPLLYCIDGLRIGFLGRGDVSDVTLISSGVVIALSLAITIFVSLVALRRSTAIRN